MCLNQIFKDEQLAIMRYALAPSGPNAAASLRALRQSQLDFQAFPYPHRPYVPSRPPPPMIAPITHPHTPAKETTDMAKSQKRSNREIRKPKAAKGKAIVPLMPQESSPVLAATRKPKGKL
ncbi:hypothetical protein FHW96_002640 [Novosphingobium sp. SG751A]|uniref:hypothetical protein n=1 Tax=Novosphingobium sp. SG751A TaxID=2587000 RepID=UPI001554A7F3|nr:hypothetical protein [Novosphingobium sp. SG751A]NOW46480.1 hypothetical protein [Novosphingobium sp. SG751A]